MTYINSNDSKPFMSDLKTIYQAKTLEVAEKILVKLEENGWINILTLLEVGKIIQIQKKLQLLRFFLT